MLHGFDISTGSIMEPAMGGGLTQELTMWSTVSNLTGNRYLYNTYGAGGADNVWGVPGYGVVKVVRKVAIPKGIGELAFTDVADWIDPTTVSFVDLDDDSTRIGAGVLDIASARA